MTIRHTYQVLATLLIATLAAVNALAQNNMYGIDNDLYRIFELGYTNRYNTNCLMFADSLEHEAIRRNDSKTECLSYLLRTSYYFRVGTTDELRASTKELRRAARRTGHMQYYFDAYNREVTRLLNDDQLASAIHQANRMKEVAYTEKDTFGIFACHRIMGHIHFAKLNFSSAMTEYKHALEFGEKNLKDQPMTAIHMYYARSLFELSRFQESLDETAKGLESNYVSGSVDVELHWTKCMNLYILGRTDEFIEAYETLQRRQKELNHHILDYEQYGIDALFHLANKDIETAEKTAQQIGDNGALARMRIFIEIERMKGDYKMMSTYLDSLIQYEEKQLNTLSDKNGAIDITASLAENELKWQNADLENVRNSLIDENSDLLSERELIEMNNIKLQLDNSNSMLQLQQERIKESELKMHQNNILYEQQEIEIQKNQLNHENQIIREQHARNIAIIIILSCSAIIIFTIVFIIYRRFSIRQLKANNARLEAARKHAEALKDKAIHNEQMKMLFLQNMGHDIRTPLNAICGFSQIITEPELSEHLSDEERKNIAELLVHNTDMLTNLVNDILCVSDLQTERYKMNVSTVNVNDMCRQSLQDVMHRKRKNVEMNFESEFSDSYTISTDRLRVQQVITNFLTNAIKHTDCGEICLQCLHDDEDPDYIIFAVADTGEGVPVDKAEVIFQRFEKLDNYHTGTGLGLSICSIISKNLGGTVGLDTTYNKGARFYFRHPLHAVVPTEENIEINEEEYETQQ